MRKCGNKLPSCRYPSPLTQAPGRLDCAPLVDHTHCPAGLLHLSPTGALSLGCTGSRERGSSCNRATTGHSDQSCIYCRVMPAGAKMYFSKASATPSLSLLATCRAVSACGCVCKLLAVAIELQSSTVKHGSPDRLQHPGILGCSCPWPHPPQPSADMHIGNCYGLQLLRSSVCSLSFCCPMQA